MEDRKIGFLDLFGKRRTGVSSVTMLPRGRIGTNGSKRLLREEGLIRTVWRMLERHYSCYDSELRLGCVPGEPLDQI